MTTPLTLGPCTNLLREFRRKGLDTDTAGGDGAVGIVAVIAASVVVVTTTLFAIETPIGTGGTLAQGDLHLNRALLRYTSRLTVSPGL